MRFYFQSSTLKINQIYSYDATTTGRAALHNERPYKLRHISNGKCASLDEKRTQKSRKSQCQSHEYITRTLQFQKANLLLFFRRSLIQTASKRAREAAASQPDPIRVCKNNISEKLILDEIDNTQDRSLVFDDFSGRHQYKQGDLTWKLVLSR